MNLITPDVFTMNVFTGQRSVVACLFFFFLVELHPDPKPVQCISTEDTGGEGGQMMTTSYFRGRQQQA